MADDAHPAHAQQRRTAVLPVIQSAAEFVEGLPRQQRSHLCGYGAGQRLAQHVAHKAANTFAGLQRHVAHKAVAHNHVRQSAEDVAPFHVADELDRQRLQQRERLTGQIVALGLFFANREQTHARRVDFEHAAGIHFAHHGKLLQIMRLAVHVRAHIQQHARIAR